MTYETDLAFLEDYEYMLATGESHDTAARRLGSTPKSLEKRLWAMRTRIKNHRKAA